MPSSRGDQSLRMRAGVVMLLSVLVAFSGVIDVIAATVLGKSFDDGRGDLTS